MSKFNIGDKVRPIDEAYGNCDAKNVLREGGHLVVVRYSNGQPRVDAVTTAGKRVYTDHNCYSEDDLILVSEAKARRTFKLIKDTPTMKKGALLQEKCDDGTQPYIMLNQVTHCKDPNYTVSITKRDLVEDQPNWFVEVFKVTPEYMTQPELDQFEAFKKTLVKQPVKKVAKTKKAAKA